MRIGHGYDVHKLVDDRNLILGGVKIPYEKGLLGHSDADVLVHSIMDSLLGACCLGDLGTHFPDTSNEFKDINSMKLLKRVVELLYKNNYKIINIDCTVIAQQPKLNPFILKMRENISDCCGIEISQINIKATTEEHLGFTGQGLGISCHSVCLIE